MSSCPRWFHRRGHWALLQVSGVGLLIAALITLGLTAGAGATAPTSGSQISNAAQAQGTVAHGPFDSGQYIDVVVPANSIFDPTEAVKIAECAAPNGVIPTQTSACDGNTVATAFPGSDGSIDCLNDCTNPSGYQVFYTPDTRIGDSASSPACGNTVATECILYIGNNQEDFTQPHVWSQFFYVNPDPTDSGTIDPGDGSAPAVASAPDPTLSTVVASPTTVTADGVDQSTVTVTLLATGSVPVAGKAVSLTSSSSTAKVTGPSQAMTDVNGQTTFTVTDTVAEPVTLTATDTTDGVALTQKPTVTFQAPGVDATHSSVSASPTTVSAGGSTTITVTLRDQAADPQPVSGKAVTLSATGSAVITPAATPNTTNASGVATFTATDTAPETVTFTATDATDGITISNTVSVTFGTLTVSASKSTVTVSTPAPLGSTGTTAVVTLLSATGSPVPNKAVSLQPSSSGTSVAIGPPSPSTTGANGQVSFQLTDSVAETVTLQAADTTDGITLASQATVTFATGAPSATASTVTASGTTSPADGETQTLINVTVKDQFGDPLSGKTVTVQGSPAGNVQEHPIAIGSATPGVTNNAGQAEFETDDTHAETVTFTATDTTDNLVLSQTVSVTYLPGSADPTAQGTTVTVSPANPPADGSTPSTVTVTLTDYFSNPIADKTIALQALNGSSKVTATNPVTNQAGQATFNVTDSTQEVVTYQATDVTDGNAVIAAEGVVKFGNPPAPPPVAAYCSTVANPNSVPADGTHTATISVLLYDGNGDPVAGKTVTLAKSGGDSTVTATNGTTNNSGMATFSVSDSTAEKVTYTADDTSDNIDLTSLPVTVTFTAVAAGSTSTTSTTTSPTSTTTTTSATSAAGTTPVATATGTSGGSSSSGNTGNTGTTSSGSSSASLASTGAPTTLPWLIGFGLLFFGVGTIGRRRLKWKANAGRPRESQ